MKSKPEGLTPQQPGRTLLLSIEDVRVQLGGISRAKFYRMLQAGEFPQACLHLGDLPRWRYCAVEAWVNACSYIDRAAVKGASRKIKPKQTKVKEKPTAEVYEAIAAAEQAQAGDALLTVKMICDRLRISSSTWTRLLETGGAPPPDARFGPRAPRWKLSTIMRFMDHSA